MGDTQDRRLLAILNLKTGKSVWADASFAPPVSETEKPAAAGTTGPDGKPGRAAEREIRWSMPSVSEDGKLVVAAARSADNKDRWFVTLDPENGKTKVIDTLHDDAWVRELVVRRLGRRVPSRQQECLVPLGTRWMDASLHPRRERRRRKAQTADTGEMGGHVRRPLARRQKVLHHVDREPSRRAAPLHALDRWRGAHEDHVDDRLERSDAVARPVDAWAHLLIQHEAARSVHHAEHTRGGRPAGDDNAHGAMARLQLDRSEGHHFQSAGWRRRLRAAVHARDDRRAAGSVAASRGLRPWRRVPAERAQVLVHLLPRVHVPQPPRVARLRRSRRGLPRELGLRPRLADGHLPPHGRKGPRRHRRRREVSCRKGERERPADRRVWRQLRWVHHADGDVHDARRLRRGRGAPPGDRLGALQPRVHVEHSQHPAEGRGGVPQELSDLFRRRPERRAAHLPRDGGRERPLSGFGAPGAAADRAPEGRIGSSPSIRWRITASPRRRAGPTSTSGS